MKNGEKWPKMAFFWGGVKNGQKWPFFGPRGAKMQKNGFFFIFDHNQRAKPRIKTQNAKKRVLWGVTHPPGAKKRPFSRLRPLVCPFFWEIFFPGISGIPKIGQKWPKMAKNRYFLLFFVFFY